jgi:hypothetical protein
MIANDANDHLAASRRKRLNPVIEDTASLRPHQPFQLVTLRVSERPYDRRLERFFRPAASRYTECFISGCPDQIGSCNFFADVLSPARAYTYEDALDDILRVIGVAQNPVSLLTHRPGMDQEESF